MGQYMEFLIEQYKQATGTKSVDIQSQTFISEFQAWIKQRQLSGTEYLGLLDYMQLYDVRNRETFEIGKGCFDTLVKDFDTTIVTPYSERILVPDSTRIITSDFSVCEGMPILLKKVSATVTDIEPIYDNNSLTFMTQNPYTPSKIEDWEQLHYNCENGIIVGVYGNTYDKDIEGKIRQLQQLKEKLYDSYIEEHSIVGDTYSYAIASKRAVKVKELVLTR